MRGGGAAVVVVAVLLLVLLVVVAGAGGGCGVEVDVVLVVLAGAVAVALAVAPPLAGVVAGATLRVGAVLDAAVRVPVADAVRRTPGRAPLRDALVRVRLAPPAPVALPVVVDVVTIGAVAVVVALAAGLEPAVVDAPPPHAATTSAATAPGTIAAMRWQDLTTGL